MPMTPLHLALGQPKKSGGSSTWARALGAGVAGASFLPGINDKPAIRDTMLSGGLGMLGTGSPWGALAGAPWAVKGLMDRNDVPAEPGPYGPGINEPVLPDEPEPGAGMGPVTTTDPLDDVPISPSRPWAKSTMPTLGEIAAQYKRLKGAQSAIRPVTGTNPADEVPITPGVPTAAAPVQNTPWASTLIKKAIAPLSVFGLGGNPTPYPGPGIVAPSTEPPNVFFNPANKATGGILGVTAPTISQLAAIRLPLRFQIRPRGGTR